MIERVCIVGAGVIGSLFAGHLASVCDVSVLTRRREHADALNRDGLRVTGAERDADPRARGRVGPAPPSFPSPTSRSSRRKRRACVRALETLTGEFEHAKVVPVLNGLGAEEIVREYGDWPIVSAVTFMSGTKHSDTHVEYILDTETWLGPYGETFERVREIAGTIERGRAEGRGATRSPPGAVVEADLQRVGEPGRRAHRPPARPALRGRARSRRSGPRGPRARGRGKAVASAAGIELHDDPWEMNVHATQRGSAHYPSMLEDVDARRETEIELITGSLIGEAERHEVGVPLTECCTRSSKAGKSPGRRSIEGGTKGRAA